jgi:[ribosomal protein S18]-alanine N-acetyltransferase
MQTRYLVRPATVSDLPRILAIERAGFGEWAWDRNLFAEYARKCGELFLVAEDGERVVGYCIGCITRGTASLESIAVAPSMKGKGVADALLRGLLRRLRRRGVGRVGLMVKVTNLRAMGFYERYCFRRVRRVPQYYEDGEDGVLFHLDL